MFGPIEVELLARALAAASSTPPPDVHPLQDDRTCDAAIDLLAACLSPVATEGKTFPCSGWDSGLGTDRAYASAITLASFDAMLVEGGKLIVPDKRQSPIFIFGETSTGYRHNKAITKLSGIVLDSDTGASWDRTLELLHALGLGYVAYESPSHTAAMPKWRVVVPFAEPYAIETDVDRARWPRVYANLRVAFGAASLLPGGGFDYKCDNPARIWYVGTRRTKDQPERRVVQREGRTFDLKTFLALFPVVEPVVTARGEYEISENPSLLELLFEDAGLLGEQIDENRFMVVCPRDSEHGRPIGDGEPDTSTIIFAAASESGEGWRGEFHCLHAHSRPDPRLPQPCPGTLRAAHVIALLEARSPGTTKKCEDRLRRARDGGMMRWAENLADATRSSPPDQDSEGGGAPAAPAPGAPPAGGTPPPSPPAGDASAGAKKAKAKPTLPPIADDDDVAAADEVEREAAKKLTQAKRVANRARQVHKLALDAARAPGAAAQLATVADEKKKILDAAIVAVEEAAKAREAAQERIRELAGEPFESGDDLTIAKFLLTVLNWPKHVVFDEGALYRYDVKCGIWTGWDREDLRKWINDHLAHVRVKAPTDANPGKTKPIALNSGKVDGIVDQVHTQARRRNFFADAPPVVCFQNGAVQIAQNGVGKKLLLVTHAPEHGARFRLETMFVARSERSIRQKLEQDPTRWNAFLDELQLDEKSKQTIHEFMGACLFGDAWRFKKAIVLYGQGDSGKSTLQDACRAMFPKDVVSASAHTEWTAKFGIQALVGKALNVVGEMPARKVESSEKFKGVIAGDILSAERKNENSFSFQPRAGHVFSANELPETSDTSGAFYNRWLIIPFTRSFADREQDKNLREALYLEAPKMAIQCVYAYQKLVNRGHYDISEQSVAAKVQWQEETDPVLRYIRTSWLPAEKDPKNWRATEMLFGEYGNWCVDQNIAPNQRGDMIRFSRTLGKTGFEDGRVYVKRGKDNVQQRGWYVMPNRGPLSGMISRLENTSENPHASPAKPAGRTN